MIESIEGEFCCNRHEKPVKAFFKDFEPPYAVYVCPVCREQHREYIFYHDLAVWSLPAWKIREMAEQKKAEFEAIPQPERLTSDRARNLWRDYERLLHTAQIVPDQRERSQAPVIEQLSLF